MNKKFWVDTLKRFSLYNTVRYSKCYLFLEKQFNRSLKETLRAEFRVYRDFLAGAPMDFLVFDIGASQGYTAETFLKLGACVLCVEPAPANVAALKERFKHRRSVTIIDKAVGESKSKGQFYLAKRSAALHTMSRKWKSYLEGPGNDRWTEKVSFEQAMSVDIVTLDLLIQKYGCPHMIKVDVEGFEYEAFLGLTTAVPRLSFEANLPEFLEETIMIIDHLNKIRNDIGFNYLTKDRLLIEEYVDADRIKELIRATSARYVEIFCKMGP